MQAKDNRSICSKDKKASIRKALLATAVKRLNLILKVFECKLVLKRLNKQLKEELGRIFVEAKWFYNHVLDLHKNNGKFLSKINACSIKSVKHLDQYGKELEDELLVLNAQLKQAIVKRMTENEKSIKTLFKRGFLTHGSLLFKSEINCIPLKQYGVTYKFKSSNKVKIAGISGNVLLRTGDQLLIVDELANANLVRKPNGYYLKVTAFINKENFKEKEKNGKEIGLDFGIKSNITTSEGEKLVVSIGESDRLKKLQRELFRRQKGSSNRHKTIALIRREYLKLSNKKTDKANKIVSKLKQYSCIVMQDEQIASWHKSLFGRLVQHSCLGLVKAKLKALSQTIILDKWIPTTKWCPRCNKKNTISLADRTYSCNCGYQEDRDVHSAKNMLAIKNLVFSKNNFVVPTEHREITLMEFKTAIKLPVALETSLDAEVRRCSVFS